MKQSKSYTRQSGEKADRLPYRPDRKHALSVSEARYKTIAFYRKRIRGKLGITHKAVNLRTFLAAGNLSDK